MSILKLFLYSVSTLLTLAIMSPSVFSRLRARLSGTPTKVTATQSTPPTAEELAQDREILQKAIEDAVASALKNEDFTKAVAGQLASQIQTSITSALDITAVETKLLASTQQLHQQAEEQSSQTASKLTNLSNLVNTNIAATAGNISTIEGTVAQINTLLSELGKNVIAIQEQVASPDVSILSSHTAKLDIIATNLQTLQEHGPTPVKSTLSAHTATLETLASELQSVKEHVASPDTSLLSSHTTKLDAIASDLQSIKDQVGSPDTTLLSSHTAKLDGLATQLAAIRDNSEVTDTLRAIVSDLISVKGGVGLGEKSFATLGDRLDVVLSSVERSIALGKENAAGLSTKIGAVTSPIEEQIANTAKALQESTKEILTALKIAAEPHAAHTQTLIEIKAGVETQSQTLSALQSADHSSEILAGIKSANDSHTTHAAALADVKAANNATSAAIAIFESQIGSIVKTLDNQSGTLGEIKAASSANAGIDAGFKNIVATLDSQTETLKDIKVAAAGTSILGAIAAQDTTLNELKEFSKADQASTEILNEVKAVKLAVEEHKVVINGIHEDAKKETQAIEVLVKGDAERSTKQAEILAEVTALKTLIATNGNAAAEHGGDYDKGVEIQSETIEEKIPPKSEINGVTIETTEVAA